MRNANPPKDFSNDPGLMAMNNTQHAAGDARDAMNKIEHGTTQASIIIDTAHYHGLLAQIEALTLERDKYRQAGRELTAALQEHKQRIEQFVLDLAVAKRDGEFVAYMRKEYPWISGQVDRQLHAAIEQGGRGNG